jgi:branched-chain amino acid transport system substrate-binding protein
VQRKAFSLLLVWLFFLIGCSGSSSGPAAGPPQTLQIGAILPVTGESPINGKAQKAAVELAVEDANEYLARIGSSIRVEAAIRDTRGLIDLESRYIDEMRDNKVPVFACSMTSNSLGLLKPQLDAGGAVVLNEVSTSPTLSYDDYLFRFVPDDRYGARVMSDLLRENGVGKVVFYYRDDVWGTTLKEELAAAFTTGGGTVADSIVYGFRTYPADIDEKVEQLNASVTQALSGTTADRVVVVLLSFEEGIEILKRAAAYPALSTVKWYTGDGLGQSNALLADASAVAFANQVGLYAPLIAEINSPAYQALTTRLHAKTGLAPYSFAPVMYDAVRLAALALAEAGGSAGRAAIKTVLLANVQTYDAVTGRINFNGAGDRSTCAYDFWAVGSIGGAYQWVKVYAGRTR